METRVLTYACLNVKYPLFLSDFKQTGISSTDLKKKNKENTHVRFYENLSNES